MRTAPIGRPQCAACVRGGQPARGDQGFKSRSLQRGVCKLSVPREAPTLNLPSAAHAASPERPKLLRSFFQLVRIETNVDPSPQNPSPRMAAEPVEASTNVVVPLRRATSAASTPSEVPPSRHACGGRSARARPAASAHLSGQPGNLIPLCRGSPRYRVRRPLARILATLDGLEHRAPGRGQSGIIFSGTATGRASADHPNRK